MSIYRKRRLRLLSCLLTTVSLLAAGIAVLLLYHTAREERRKDLVITVKGQARLIEAIVHQKTINPLVLDHIPDDDPLEASVQLVISAHRAFNGFGETSEFTLAQRVGDQIVFRFRYHSSPLFTPPPIPFNSDLAEPMRRALSGQSGSLIGLDYKRDTVLAAYEPILGLNLGIVAKISLSEVKQPFYSAAFTVFSLTLLLVLLGIYLLRRALDPVFTSLHLTTTDLENEITQHKLALAALKENEARFLQIAAAAEDVFWLIDCADCKRLKILYVNSAFEKIWQRPVEAVLGDPNAWFEPIHPQDIERVRCAYLNFVAGTENFDLEFRICLDDGTERQIWTKGGLIRDGAGKIIRAAGLASDISAIKAAEIMVQKANQDLEDRVEERTAELSRTIRLMTGREIRMAELKREISLLKQELLAVRERR